jgi:hypothetical protein
VVLLPEIICDYSTITPHFSHLISRCLRVCISRPRFKNAKSFKLMVGNSQNKQIGCNSGVMSDRMPHIFVKVTPTPRSSPCRPFIFRVLGLEIPSIADPHFVTGVTNLKSKAGLFSIAVRKISRAAHSSTPYHYRYSGELY